MENENKDKLYMIVNGEPIEMCPKTLNLCNKRAQNMITSLKKQSLEKVHTMRLFWGDVVMLNIITNQLLQKVDSRSLARVLKPVTTLQEDLDEYREVRKNKIENLKNALITANDDTLPLDYSRELEKYYRTTVDEEEVDLDIDKLQIPPEINKPAPSTTDVPTKEEESSTKEKDKISENSQKKGMNKQQDEKKSGKTSTVKNKNIYRSDDNEEVVDFSFKPVSNGSKEIPNQKQTDKSKKKSNGYNINSEKSSSSKETSQTIENSSPNSQQKTTNASPATAGNFGDLFENKKIESGNNKQETQSTKTELEKHQEAFTSYGSLDLDSLFN